MRMSALVTIVIVAIAGVAASPAFAGDSSLWSTGQPCASEPARASVWAVDWTSAHGRTPAALAAPALAAANFGILAAGGQTTSGRVRTVAFEYSDGYKVRAKVHKVASIATLPLFVAEYLVGQNLYNNPGTASGSARGAHGALAAATGVLFGINTITGVWNMVEARSDPNRSTKRTIHAVLMLLADAGFVATGATAPNSEHGRLETGGGSRSTHRTIALTSMGIATVSYLMMLVGGN